MNFDSMARPRRVPTQNSQSYNLKLVHVCLLAIAAFCSSLISTASPVRADGGLKTQKGGLFHRKGWITPSIYRKEPTTKRGYSTNARSRLGGPVPPVSKAKSTVQKARLVVNDEEGQSNGARRKARQSKRRIPARIVRKRERTVTKTARSRPAKKHTRVASLGKTLELPSETRKRTASVTGSSGRVQWVASSGCVPGTLKAAINHVAQNFGRVRVNSTCRSRSRNRRVGGAGKSWHLKGQAADIRVFGNIGNAARYLRQVVGGFKHYGGGLFHIDTGPRRSW